MLAQLIDTAEHSQQLAKARFSRLQTLLEGLDGPAVEVSTLHLLASHAVMASMSLAGAACAAAVQLDCMRRSRQALCPWSSEPVSGRYDAGWHGSSFQ